MEHVGVAAQSGSRDQLEPELLLDFDSNLETGAEGFEFEENAPFDQIDIDFPEESAGDDSAMHLHNELDLEVDEERSATANGERVQMIGAAEDVGSNAEADAGYQDEIGYEDDDHVPADSQAGSSTSQAHDAEGGLQTVLSEDHTRAAPPTEDNRDEFSAHDKDVSWEQTFEFEEVDDGSQDEHGAAEGEDEESADNAKDHSMTVDDGTTHDDSDRRGSDLEDALEDLARSLAEVPDIEVLYDEECFSLFGTPDDDPDSYFLSDVKELDRPLSQFLSAIRTVISDDFAPTDELVVRLDPLGLEFGERSNEKFLSRSFREVVGCYTSLREASGVSGDAVVHLMVRRDSEEHFLELLAKAATAQTRSHGAGESELSEDLDIHDRAHDSDDEQSHDQLPDDEDASGNHEEVESVGEEAADTFDTGFDDVHVETECAVDDAHHQDEAAEEQNQDVKIGAPAPHSPAVQAEKPAGAEHLDAASAEAQLDEYGLAGDENDGEQSWDAQEAEGDLSNPQHVDTAPELLDELAHESTPLPEDVDKPLEDPENTDFNNAYGVTAPEIDEPEQEAPLNDDNLVLAFDDDAPLATHEEHLSGDYDGFTIAHDVSENIATDNNIDATQEILTAEAHEEFLITSTEDGNHLATADDSASRRTSTTINGDEISYDERLGADQASAPAQESIRQSAIESNIDNDEIDWENDEDEYEQPSAEDEGVELEDSNEADLSPPSVAGKRSRTDETESLADETDHKRRRT